MGSRKVKNQARTYRKGNQPVYNTGYFSLFNGIAINIWFKKIEIFRKEGITGYEKYD